MDSSYGIDKVKEAVRDWFDKLAELRILAALLRKRLDLQSFLEFRYNLSNMLYSADDMMNIFCFYFDIFSW